MNRQTKTIRCQCYDYLVSLCKNVNTTEWKINAINANTEHNRFSLKSSQYQSKSVRLRKTQFFFNKTVAGSLIY